MMLPIQALGHSMLPLILFAFALLVLLPVNSGEPSQVVCDDQPRVYIVHLRKPEHKLSASPEEVEEWHKSFLPSPTTADSGEPRMVFSYKVVMSGFAARLTAAEVRAMEAKEGFLGAHPDEALVHQTTYSPFFLGLRGKVWRDANRGEDAIIGVIDSGITPDHVSFRGNPISTTPAGWHGWCAFNNQPTCNDKLLGAKYLPGQGVTLPPCEGSGHGTHLDGIAAGLEVDASVRGCLAGTAAGAAPGAYLAVYKASTKAEILRSIEQAIEDGVSTMSISMSVNRKDPQVPLPLHEDEIAIGALAAVRRGILVSCSACNDGPDRSTVCNDAPWIMTVGASTMGRVLSFILKLGNGEEIPGESLYTQPGLSAELVYPGANGDADNRLCKRLLRATVAGKVVMCVKGAADSAAKADVVRRAGGVAMVLMNSKRMGSIITDIVDVPGLPTVTVNNDNAWRLVNYLNTGRLHPHRVQFIPKQTTYRVAPFPAVPFFSSRGPSLVNGGILKPDILGPGVNILSAKANTSSEFVLKSGTSMAAPHLSGIAAILQRYQPTKTGLAWSPAMIRSTIMTTADTTNRQGRPITDQTDGVAGLFATGAGHVNPTAAMDPGLVYDLHFEDYVRYLCRLGYTDDQVYKTAGESVKCDQPGRAVDPEQLNYPSISVTLRAAMRRKTIKRTVTNVGPERSNYRYEVSTSSAWRGVKVDQVVPKTLDFTSRGEKRSFEVTFFLVTPVEHGEVFQGLLKWVSATHTVTTPLLVNIKETSAAGGDLLLCEPSTVGAAFLAGEVDMHRTH